MNSGNVAALIRGLLIDITGKPQFVITGEAGTVSDSDGVMVLELNHDEAVESAAVKIRAAYEAWKKAAPHVPSCVVLKLDGKHAATFWTDNDFDSARKRLQEKNASSRTGKKPVTNAKVKTEDRASVVKNKIALVTGGAQGIGEEIVRNLAAAGALVFIADMNMEGAIKLAEDINTEEGRNAAIALEVNVSREDSVYEMINSIAVTSGGLDLCVSNAGVLRAGSVLEQELNDFKFVTDINYTGFFVVSKYAGRLLKTQHLTAPTWKTDIVQINSKSGLEGSNKNGAYAGGKFGGIGLVASFAMELVEYNIKVNAICPGNFLDGPLWSHPEKGLFVQYLNTGKVPGAKTLADVRAAYEARVPMKRGCTGKDLVRALFYTVEQEYETGQAVPVTGGQIMLH